MIAVQKPANKFGENRISEKAKISAYLYQYYVLFYSDGSSFKFYFSNHFIFGVRRRGDDFFSRDAGE